MMAVAVAFLGIPAADVNFSFVYANPALDESEPRRTPVMFDGIENTFTSFSNVFGIYIHRTESARPDEVFYGSAIVDPTLLAGVVGFVRFQFEAFRFLNGEWVPTNWIVITDTTPMSVFYEFRKSMPPGRYAIRATALVRDPSNLALPPRPAYIFDEFYQENVRLESMHTIVYADSLRYIVTSADGSSVVNARDVRGDTINIFVASNEGAMDTNMLPPGFIDGDIIMGNMYVNAEITLQEMTNITIERRGRQLNDHQTELRVSLAHHSNDMLTVFVPYSLTANRYVIRFSHPHHPEVFGSFVIDNFSASRRGADLRSAAFPLILTGTILVGISIILFLWPKIAFTMQDRKYQRMENQRYMSDGEGSKDDYYYKAQSAGASYRASRDKTKKEVGDMLEGDEKVGFLDSMRDSKARREYAREAGLSMAEYRELENKAKKMKDAKAGGFYDFRKMVDEAAGMTTSEPKREDGLVDEIATMAPRATPETTEEPVVESSFLSRLRNLSDE